jgi:hypothetical protein
MLYLIHRGYNNDTKTPDSGGEAMIWLVIAVPFIVVSLAATVLCVGACMMSSRLSSQEGVVKRPAAEVWETTGTVDDLAKAS